LARNGTAFSNGQSANGASDVAEIKVDEVA
jgi:hypothetical protein